MRGDISALPRYEADHPRYEEAERTRARLVRHNDLEDLAYCAAVYMMRSLFELVESGKEVVIVRGRLLLAAVRSVLLVERGALPRHAGEARARAGAQRHGVEFATDAANARHQRR